MARPPIKVPGEATLPGIASNDAGAAGCLAFLQRQELEAREPIMAAKAALDEVVARGIDPAFDGEDMKKREQEIREAQTRLAIARDEHREASKSMKAYETIVAPEKRGDGEKVTQSAAAAMVTVVTTHIRFGIQQALLSAAQGIQLCETEVAAVKFLEPLFDQAVNSSIENAIIEGQIPKWMADAVKDGM